MDYLTIQKFSKLSLSPPLETDNMAKKNKELVALREALKLAGNIEKTARKSDLLKDKKLVESEEYLELKKEFDALSYDVRRSVDKIKHEMLFGTELNDASADYDDNERGGGRSNRYTNLRPNNNGNRQRSQSRRREDNNRGDRGDRGDRSDRDGGARRNNNRNEEGRGQRGAGAARASKPVFNDDNFPTI